MVLVLSTRIALQNRAVRRFVRSIRLRSDSAEQRVPAEETALPRSAANPRASAIQMQQVRTLMREAEKAVVQGKLEEAERCYIQALTVRSDADDVQAELAKLYLTMGRHAKAEALYRELITRNDDVSYFSNLGLAYYKQQKYQEACQSYQEALNRDPANPERSYALGRACMAARRYEEAAPLLDKASQRMSRDTGLLHMLAECYLQLGYKDHAEEAYRRINKLQPYDEDVKAKLSSLART